MTENNELPHWPIHNFSSAKNNIDIDNVKVSIVSHP